MTPQELVSLERRLLDLPDLVKKYKNHPQKHDFATTWTARFMVETYRLEGEVLDLRCCESAMSYLQTVTDLNTEDIRIAHSLLLPEYGGEYRTKEAYAGHHMFAPPSTIARAMETAVQNFNKSDGDPIQAASQLFIDVINIHPFPDGNGRLLK